MISFVNIETEQFWDFESWDFIRLAGGLKQLLPVEQWKLIWNEEASYKEPAHAFISLEDEYLDRVDRNRAATLFVNRKK